MLMSGKADSHCCNVRMGLKIIWIIGFSTLKSVNLRAKCSDNPSRSSDCQQRNDTTTVFNVVNQVLYRKKEKWIYSEQLGGDEDVGTSALLFKGQRRQVITAAVFPMKKKWMKKGKKLVRRAEKVRRNRTSLPDDEEHWHWLLISLTITLPGCTVHRAHEQSKLRQPN